MSIKTHMLLVINSHNDPERFEATFKNADIKKVKAFGREVFKMLLNPYHVYIRDLNTKKVLFEKSFK